MKIILLTASLLLSLVFVEAIARSSGYRPSLLSREMFLAGHPYTLTPHFSDGNITIDSDGNRVVINKREPKTLLLGDSVVFGQGLRDDETIASRVGISNLGVPGYSSWNEYQALIMYPHEVDRIILIYVPNDVTFNNDHADISGGGFDVSQSLFHRTTNAVYRHWYSGYIAREGLRAIMQPRIPGTNWAALEYSMDAIEKIGKLKPLTVGIYRDVSCFSAPVATKEYEAKVAQALDRRGIQHFLIHSHTDNLRESEVKVGWNDPHPSARAVTFIAQDITAQLSFQSANQRKQ